MFGIKYIFTFTIVCILGQAAGLVTLPRVVENDILKTESVIRKTTNALFSSLRLRNIRNQTWMKQYSLIHNYFISLTLQDYNSLKEIAKLTRVDKGNIENVNANFITLINEILDDENIIKLETILEEEDIKTGYDIESEKNKLEKLKKMHAKQHDKIMNINKEVLKILQQEESLNLNVSPTKASTKNSSNEDILDEVPFWNETDKHFNGRRIYNGKRSKIVQFPFMASVQIFNKFQCAGCIIKSDLVITAASCLQLAWNNRFYRENPSFLSVRVGSSFYELSGEKIGVQEIYFNPEYNPKNLHNNLALMRLERKIKFNKKVKKIHLDKKNHMLPQNTEDIEILGWGATSHSNKLHGPWENKLRHAVLHVYPHDECRDLYSKEYVTNTNFCAGYMSSGTGACNHDIGGPGIVSGTLTGIISFGAPNCGSSDAPTVFTKLGFYYDWIEDIMEQEIPYSRIKTTLTPTWSLYPRKYNTHTFRILKPRSTQNASKSPSNNIKHKHGNLTRTLKKNTQVKKNLFTEPYKNTDNNIFEDFVTLFDGEEKYKYLGIEGPTQQKEKTKILETLSAPVKLDGDVFDKPVSNIEERSPISLGIKRNKHIRDFNNPIEKKALLNDIQILKTASFQIEPEYDESKFYTFDKNNLRNDIFSHGATKFGLNNIKYQDGLLQLVNEKEEILDKLQKQFKRIVTSAALEGKSQNMIQNDNNLFTGNLQNVADQGKIGGAINKNILNVLNNRNQHEKFNLLLKTYNPDLKTVIMHQVQDKTKLNNFTQSVDTNEPLFIELQNKIKQLVNAAAQDENNRDRELLNSILRISELTKMQEKGNMSDYNGASWEKKVNLDKPITEMINKDFKMSNAINNDFLKNAMSNYVNKKYTPITLQSKVKKNAITPVPETNQQIVEVQGEPNYFYKMRDNIKQQNPVVPMGYTINWQEVQPFIKPVQGYNVYPQYEENYENKQNNTLKQLFTNMILTDHNKSIGTDHDKLYNLFQSYLVELTTEKMMPLKEMLIKSELDGKIPPQQLFHEKSSQLRNQEEEVNQILASLDIQEDNKYENMLYLLGADTSTTLNDKAVKNIQNQIKQLVSAAAYEEEEREKEINNHILRMTNDEEEVQKMETEVKELENSVKKLLLDSLTINENIYHQNLQLTSTTVPQKLARISFVDALQGNVNMNNNLQLNNDILQMLGETKLQENEQDNKIKEFFDVSLGIPEAQREYSTHIENNIERNNDEMPLLSVPNMVQNSYPPQWNSGNTDMVLQPFEQNGYSYPSNQFNSDGTDKVSQLLEKIPYSMEYKYLTQSNSEDGKVNGKAYDKILQSMNNAPSLSENKYSSQLYSSLINEISQSMAGIPNIVKENEKNTVDLNSGMQNQNAFLFENQAKSIAGVPNFVSNNYPMQLNSVMQTKNEMHNSGSSDKGSQLLSQIPHSIQNRYPTLSNSDGGQMDGGVYDKILQLMNNIPSVTQNQYPSQFYTSAIDTISQSFTEIPNIAQEKITAELNSVLQNQNGWLLEKQVQPIAEVPNSETYNYPMRFNNDMQTQNGMYNSGGLDKGSQLLAEIPYSTQNIGYSTFSYSDGGKVDGDLYDKILQSMNNVPRVAQNQYPSQSYTSTTDTISQSFTEIPNIAQEKLTENNSPSLPGLSNYAQYFPSFAQKQKEVNPEKNSPSLLLPLLQKYMVESQQNDKIPNLNQLVNIQQNSPAHDTFSSEIANIASNYEGISNNLKSIFSLLQSPVKKQYVNEKPPFSPEDKSKIIQNQIMPMNYLRTKKNEPDNDNHIMKSYFELLKNDNAVKKKFVQILPSFVNNGSNEVLQDDTKIESYSEMELPTILTLDDGQIEDSFNAYGNIEQNFDKTQIAKLLYNSKVKAFTYNNSIAELYSSLLNNEHVAKNKITEILATLLANTTENIERNDSVGSLNERTKYDTVTDKIIQTKVSSQNEFNKNWEPSMIENNNFKKDESKHYNKEDIDRINYDQVPMMTGKQQYRQKATRTEFKSFNMHTKLLPLTKTLSPLVEQEGDFNHLVD